MVQRDDANMIFLFDNQIFVSHLDSPLIRLSWQGKIEVSENGGQTTEDKRQMVNLEDQAALLASGFCSLGSLVTWIASSQTYSGDKKSHTSSVAPLIR